MREEGWEDTGDDTAHLCKVYNSHSGDPYSFGAMCFDVFLSHSIQPMLRREKKEEDSSKVVAGDRLKESLSSLIFDTSIVDHYQFAEKPSKSECWQNCQLNWSDVEWLKWWQFQPLDGSVQK